MGWIPDFTPENVMNIGTGGMSGSVQKAANGDIWGAVRNKGMMGFDPYGGNDGSGNGGVDYSSQPGFPGYSAAYDPASMAMSPELNRRLANNNLDKTGMDKFKAEAFRVGPSQWATLQNSNQDLQARGQQDANARQAMATTAGARSQLAMHGGLSSGASERIATAGATGAIKANQDTARQANLNKAQIGINDEQNRISQLGQVPGMDMNAANFDLDKTRLWGQGAQYDTTNAINEGNKRNEFNMGKYHEQMAGWAAGQQANATANSGKK